MEYPDGSVVGTLLSLLRDWVQSLWRTKILQASSTAWPEKKKKYRRVMGEGGTRSNIPGREAEMGNHGTWGAAGPRSQV